MNQKTNRRISLDVMRIVAVLAVVLLHSSSTYLSLYSAGTQAFVVANLYNSLSRIGVPLFLMISGALMLDQEKPLPLRVLVGKKIKGIVWLLIFWSVVYDVLYQIVLPYVLGEGVDMQLFLQKLLYGHYHIWYLYMLIGLYLITPFLRTFATPSNQKLVLIFLGISLVAQFTIPVWKGISLIWPAWYRVVTYMDKFKLSFFCGYTAYYLAGWYVIHIGFQKKWQKVGICMASVLAFLITVVYVQVTGDYTNGHEDLNLFVFFYSVGVFYVLSRCRTIPNRRLEKLVVAGSGLTFGVYIIHPIVLYLWRLAFPYSGHLVLYIPVIFALTVVVSAGVCVLMRKIPGVRKLIRA